MMNKGFLLVLMQPPPTMEDEFNAWYDTEHIAERLAVPGFETALRYVCTDGAPLYLALYDLASQNVLNSPAYLKVGFDTIPNRIPFQGQACPMEGSSCKCRPLRRELTPP
jgi:hypothetical protein